MTAYGICSELPRPQRADLRQAAKYYGVRSDDSVAEQVLARAEQAVLPAVTPRMVWNSYTTEELKDLLTGEDIRRHLAGCSGCILLAVTIGSEADRAVRAAAVGDVARGAAADAVASALAEQAADEAENLLRESFRSRGLYVTGRFSPGYGDWPLARQKDIAALLNLPKAIGVTVTESLLMVPRKSITALMGISEQPVTGYRAGCSHCALRENCQFRKRGETCANQ